MRITDRKRNLLVVPLALAALALVAWYAPGGATAAPGGEGSSAVTSSSVTVLTTPAEPVHPRAAGPASGRMVPVAHATDRHCQARDLTLVSIQGDGAAGHIAWVVMVANTSSRSCALLGDPVVVVFRDAAGRLVALPTERAAREPSGSRLLAPGQRADMALYMVNGYGGYDPSAPECAHPVVYRDLSARIGRGLLPLSGLVIDLKCDGITAYDWAASQS